MTTNPCSACGQPKGQCFLLCPLQDPFHGEALAEHEDHESGVVFGDPRRCPRHPHRVTSSPDGIFDAPCPECEAAMSADEDEIYAPSRRFVNPFVTTMPAPAPKALTADDDIPF